MEEAGEKCERTFPLAKDAFLLKVTSWAGSGRKQHGRLMDKLYSLNQQRSRRHSQRGPYDVGSNGSFFSRTAYPESNCSDVGFLKSATKRQRRGADEAVRMRPKLKRSFGHHGRARRRSPASRLRVTLVQSCDLEWQQNLSASVPNWSE